MPRDQDAQLSLPNSNLVIQDTIMSLAEVVHETQVDDVIDHDSTKGKAKVLAQSSENVTQKGVANNFQMGPFVNRSSALKIFDVGHVQQSSPLLNNEIPIIFKQVTTQNVTVQKFNYNVPVDDTPSNGGVRNDSLHEAASLNLGKLKSFSPIIDPTNTAINSNPFPVNNMNVLGWNIRGLGKKTTSKELNLLCRNINPNIIFLSETKMNKDLAARRIKIFGFPCTFNVPSISRSGGLVLACNKEIQLNILSSSLRGIYVTTTDTIHFKVCHLHFIYGEPNSSLRKSFWEDQCQLPKPPLDEPVFFICDFNALLGTKDKNGGLEVDDSDFLNLRNFCDTFDLHDPGFSGPRFTWSNMQQGPDLILERLDRCLINLIAETLFPKLCVNNLSRDSSDHCPTHIGFNYDDVCMPRPFHLMAMWVEDPICRDIIANSWRELGDTQTIAPIDCKVISRLKARLEYLYNLEELYWKDKSREVWLMEGDINSPYFHRVTLFRRNKNDISWIKNAAGTILTDRHSINTSFIDHFKTLYSSNPQQFQDEILLDLPVKFFENDNSYINSPLTAEEIKNVVFQMGGEKAPGLDGFTDLFYQKYWDIVGEAVVDMTQTCFKT
ncbi:uncharacterized protein LOC113291034 [Papaver somniferum]|uniref:uncharacterized protein LOC113291034 n=1 Tax=Papaver somniferum TaxID=3469 RepID=UPI000E703D25|nr:uncharacterized protein LOC113291034 [Papaver somniferum]